MKLRKIEAFSNWEGENTRERKKSQGERTLATCLGLQGSPESAAENAWKHAEKDTLWTWEFGAHTLLEYVLLPTRQDTVTLEIPEKLAFAVEPNHPHSEGRLNLHWIRLFGIIHLTGKEPKTSARKNKAQWFFKEKSKIHNSMLTSEMSESNQTFLAMWGSQNIWLTTRKTGQWIEMGSEMSEIMEPVKNTINLLLEICLKISRKS